MGSFSARHRVSRRQQFSERHGDATTGPFMWSCWAIQGTENSTQPYKVVPKIDNLRLIGSAMALCTVAQTKCYLV
jgi:hypothetical protein